MRIALGANGRTGRPLPDQSTDGGHEVVALVMDRTRMASTGATDRDVTEMSTMTAA